MLKLIRSRVRVKLVRIRVTVSYRMPCLTEHRGALRLATLATIKFKCMAWPMWAPLANREWHARQKNESKTQFSEAARWLQLGTGHGCVLLGLDSLKTNHP